MLKSFTALFLALLLSITTVAGETKPAQSVPDFAMGVLSFRALGTGVEKVGLYANQLMPNSAALAQQIAMSYLFSLPADAGLKKDGPARVFLLDPIATGVQNERAFTLRVADAAAVKNALIGAYGAPAEADGVMSFTLVQPLPQPDRTLLIKIADGQLLAAPNLAVLKKLEEFEKANAPVAYGDAVVSIRVGAVKRAYAELMELSIDAMVELAAGEQADNVREITKLVDTLWQFETVDLALNIDAKGDTGQLEINAFPKAETPIAVRLGKPGMTLSDRAIRLIPEKAGLFAAWIVNGPELSQTLHKQLGKQAENAPPATKPLALAFEKALVDLVAACNGEVAVSLSGTDLRSPLILLGADVSDEALAIERAGAAIETLVALVNPEMKRDAGAALNGKEALELKKSVSESNGLKIHAFEVLINGLSEDQRLDISELAGWPPTVRATVVDKKLILTLGRESTEDLLAAVVRLKAPVNVSDPGLRAMKEAVANGSQAAVSLGALNLAKLILARTPLPPDTTLDRLLRGLSDQPAVLSGRALNIFSVKLDLPSGAAHAIGSIVQRADKAKRAAAAGDAAPPPPPAR